MAGAIVSVCIIIAIIPVEMLRAKLKKRHRELTELTDLESRGGGGTDASSSMIRYLQDNQRYSQQDLSSLNSVPFNQNGYNQPQQYVYYPQQFNNTSNLQNNHTHNISQEQYQQMVGNISQEQYQQMGHASQQNYLMQQHLLQQHRNLQQKQQEEQQSFNYQPTHPAYYQ